MPYSFILERGEGARFGDRDVRMLASQRDAVKSVLLNRVQLPGSGNRRPVPANV
jgi:hypothetical protein